jgi:hypothetical protein
MKPPRRCAAASLYEMLDEKPSVCSAWSGPSMGGQKLTLDIATMARSRVSMNHTGFRGGSTPERIES